MLVIVSDIRSDAIAVSEKAVKYISLPGVLYADVTQLISKQTPSIHLMRKALLHFLIFSHIK